MGAIKKVWVTNHDSDLVSLSLESENADQKFLRIRAHEFELPEVPSVRHPLRHVISVSLLNEEDLKKVLLAICKYLQYDIQID